MESSIDKKDWNKECCGVKWNLNHVIRCLKCDKTLREHRKFPKNIKEDSMKKSHTDDTVNTVDTNKTVNTKGTIE